MAGGESPVRGRGGKGGDSPVRGGKGNGKDSTPVKIGAPDKNQHVKGDGIKVEKTLKRRRVDNFSSGFVDLVTDRVKNKWFSMFVIVIFPLLLLNLLIVRQLSSVPDHWLDQIPAHMAILTSPSDLVLGVKSKSSGKSLTVLVANSNHLPTLDSQVEVSFVSMVPEAEFDFCSNIIEDSYRDERLGAVCSARFYSNTQDTDSSGIAVFDDFAIVGGVPGTYVLNVTVSKVQEFVDEFGREGTGAIVGAHSWFQVKVHRNLNITVTPTTLPPKAIEYRTIFNGRGTVCSTPADLGTASCTIGDREDLRPPAASIVYTGGDDLSNATTVTFFLIANFSEVLWRHVEFPRTNYPHLTGSVDRMARMTKSGGGFQFQETIMGLDGGTGVSEMEGGTGWGGTIEFEGFQVLGASNPALFFAFYCNGVFGVWNKNWMYEFPGNELDGRPPASIQQVLEMTMLPRPNEKGVRPAQGEWWIGAVTDPPAEIGDDGVAAGDQAYLSQVIILQVAAGPIGEAKPLYVDLIEDEEFEMRLDTYSLTYPRSRKRQTYLDGVIIFAEAVPISGINGHNREDFRKRSKVLLNAVSPASSVGDAPEDTFTMFPNLAFSQEGDEGIYRIRVFAEGHWHDDSSPIRVRTKINMVVMRLPASVQMQWPGCDTFMTLPPKDANGDGNPDSDFPTSQEMAMCFETQPFTPLTDLPYVEAYVCGKSIASLRQSCNPISGKQIKVTINSAPDDPFSNDANGERQWMWPKEIQDLTRDRDVTELPAVSYQQKLPGTISQKLIHCSI